MPFHFNWPPSPSTRITTVQDYRKCSLGRSDIRTVISPTKTGISPSSCMAKSSTNGKVQTHARWVVPVSVNSCGAVVLPSAFSAILKTSLNKWWTYYVPILRVVGFSECKHLSSLRLRVSTNPRSPFLAIYTTPEWYDWHLMSTAIRSVVVCRLIFQEIWNGLVLVGVAYKKNHPLCFSMRCIIDSIPRTPTKRRTSEDPS